MSQLLDKKGDEDDDLNALEQRLASAKYKPPAVSWEKQAVAARARRWPLAAFTAAAAVVIAVVAWRTFREPRFGEWLDTTKVAVLRMEGIGEVTVEPLSRVRWVESSATAQRLELQRGALHAKVTAPPRLFVVDTPAAKAVDLGCEYTLVVDPKGSERLEVLKGEVSLEGEGLSSRVYEGSTCVTQKGQPPRIPRSRAAAPPFLQALDAWEGHAGALEAVLASAQATDAESLWNVMSRVQGAEREAVLTRLFAMTVAPVKDFSRAAALTLDPKAMESLWEVLP